MSAVNILVGTESFAELRGGETGEFCKTGESVEFREPFYYVDKTGFLESFLSPLPAKVSLFTRPRRFGKSTFLSMLAEFFACRENESDSEKERRRELFQGLKIAANEKLCATWMHQYPVLSLSLKDVDKPTYEEAIQKIQALIGDVCLEHICAIESPKLDEKERDTLGKLRWQEASLTTLADALLILTRALSYHFGKPAIVLIDEYDVPVEKAAKYGYEEKMNRFMGNFFSAGLKTNKFLKFAILTGCLRVAKESIYSCFNNPKCYGISDLRFADVFGFTQVEVDQLLADAGLMCKREELRAWYDGYRFGNKQEIYCPWSIMNYISDTQENPAALPKAHWRHSSENALIRKFIAEKTPEVGADMATLLAGGCLVKRIREDPTYESLDFSSDNIWSLFYMTGYLTEAPEEIKGRCQPLPDPDLGEMALVIPNKEIWQLLVEEVSLWFNTAVRQGQQNALYTAFWRADAVQLVEVLEEILQSNISFHDLAQKENDGEALRENYYHGLLTGYFLVAYPKTCSNLEAGKGRFDIQVLDDTREGGSWAAIVELKRTADESADLAALAQKGLDQIREKQYDVRLLADPNIKTVLHWSIAFCKKNCCAKAVVVRGGQAC